MINRIHIFTILCALGVAACGGGASSSVDSNQSPKVENSITESPKTQVPKVDESSSEESKPEISTPESPS